MNIRLYLIILFVFAMLSSCGGSLSKNDSPTSEIQPAEEVVLKAPQFMQDSDITVPVKVGEREFQSNVVRRPDNNLPMVSNEQGQKYVDNRITLTLREGGRLVVSKEFTKNDFLSFLDAGFQRHAILEGLVFDKVEGRNILYAASVAYPESDLYVPFQITVTPAGNISIEKSDVMDEYEATPDSLTNQQ
ncbi:MAG: DUF4738 domain-containing protein [Bacteroidaceae bacterium]|nr:DUF4738 domain-containing protein [Bacteroidaceae bacterium]